MYALGITGSELNPRDRITDLEEEKTGRHVQAPAPPPRTTKGPAFSSTEDVRRAANVPLVG